VSKGNLSHLPLPFKLLGDYILPAGEELKFRYRIYIRKGDIGEGKVAEKYHN